MWLLRLESIGYVILGLVSVLALSFLVLLAPLLIRAMTRYVPTRLPSELPTYVPNYFQTLLYELPDFDGTTTTVYRFTIAAMLIIVPLIVVHKWLPAGKRRFRDIMPGILAMLCSVASRRRDIRPIPRGFRLHLLRLLCRPRLADDRARVSLFHRLDLHLWRRTQRHHFESAGNRRSRSLSPEPRTRRRPGSPCRSRNRTPRLRETPQCPQARPARPIVLPACAQRRAR